MQNFLLGSAMCEQFEHVLNSDAHSPNAGAATALFRIKADTFQVVHGTYSKLSWPLKQVAICASGYSSIRRLGIETTRDDGFDVLLRDPAEVMVAGLDAQVGVVAVFDSDEFALGNRADAVGTVEGRKAQRGLLRRDDHTLNPVIEADGRQLDVAHEQAERNSGKEDRAKNIL